MDKTIECVHNVYVWLCWFYSLYTRSVADTALNHHSLTHSIVYKDFCTIFHMDGWFPLGTTVSSTSETDISSSFHHLDMTLAIPEALSRSKVNPTPILDFNIVLCE